MARLTVERCKFDHFELAALAAERAEQLTSGAVPTIAKGKDKFTVLALREIEAGNIDIEQLRNRIISKNQMYGDHDNNSDEENTHELPDEFVGDDDYTPSEEDFSGFGDISIEEFDNDNIFSDDISEEEK
ncbi:MAG UNVERIFIED_CONTAM: DNA-directed RNA polymerase subunit omega [Rickettsiaceae bacterium]|jgi:DNA-directed RNA polymerase subunit omega